MKQLKDGAFQSEEMVLSMKTIGSYEQTMRLFIRFSNEQGIVQTEKVTHMMVQNYISVN